MRRYAIFLTVAVLAIPRSAKPEVLYGVTSTDLVTVDLSNLTVTVIGPHGLPAGYLATSLAYDVANDILVGNALVSGAGQHLVHYDRATGNGTVVAQLGTIGGGVFEGIEFVDSLGWTLVTIAPASNPVETSQIHFVDLVGSKSFLVQANPSIDQDFAVFDSLRAVFYSTDPNGIGAGDLTAVDLGNGVHSIQGSIPTSCGDLAYSADLDVFVANSTATNVLYRASATPPVNLAGGSIGMTSVQIRGLAFAPPPATATTNYCTAGTSASGCNAILSATGSASATASSGFTLDASGVEGQKDGLLFFGTNGQQANPWGNGTSYQCVVPPVKRCGLLAGTGTVGACDGAISQDLNAFWCPACPKPGHNPGAGAVVQAQLWYRDPLSTSNQTTSLSDAVEFVLGP